MNLDSTGDKLAAIELQKEFEQRLEVYRTANNQTIVHGWVLFDMVSDAFDKGKLQAAIDRGELDSEGWT